VSGDGKIVILEDRSVWMVDALDRLDSILWLPTDDVIVVPNDSGGYLLINPDDDTTVNAQLLRR
jgi:hypothetical protein